MNIAVITCYDQQDYIRAKGLRAAFGAAPDVELRVVRNRHKGLLRYIEVPLRILALRFRGWPDAYVITFRGYEMLLFMCLTFTRKPIIFDEMINFVEYYQEHGVVKSGTLPYKLLRVLYAWQLRRCHTVIADTDAHADYSAEVCAIPREKYLVLPVSADEQLCRPYPEIKRVQKPFTVFYYGTLTPLHGAEWVLEAAKLLKDNPDIHFNIVGGRDKARQACEEAVKAGAHVTYEEWLPFDQLFRRAAAAGLCLGGPFGKTLQSQFVITGKTYQFLASGAPVLVGQNKVSGQFKDKQNCLLVPPADPQAIADAISWAAAHPKEMARIAQTGRALYENHFAQSIVNDKVRALVNAL
jgi:glycosyltransferase involved in cell wall biosynthesis